jgi:hypothetical protein
MWGGGRKRTKVRSSGPRAGRARAVRLPLPSMGQALLGHNPRWGRQRWGD